MKKAVESFRASFEAGGRSIALGRCRESYTVRSVGRRSCRAGLRQSRTPGWRGRAGRHVGGARASKKARLLLRSSRRSIAPHRDMRLMPAPALLRARAPAGQRGEQDSCVAGMMKRTTLLSQTTKLMPTVPTLHRFPTTVNEVADIRYLCTQPRRHRGSANRVSVR